MRSFNCGSRNVRHHCHRSGLAPPDAGSLPAGGATKVAGRAAAGVEYFRPRAHPANAPENTIAHARFGTLMRILPENHISLARSTPGPIRSIRKAHRQKPVKTL